jgi:hypothetical protein
MVFRRFFPEWTFEAGSSMKKGPVGTLSVGIMTADGVVWGTDHVTLKGIRRHIHGRENHC